MVKRSKRKKSSLLFNPLEKTVPKRVKGPAELAPKLDPTTADLEDLLPIGAARLAPDVRVDETEASRRYLALLRASYETAQAAALATAQLELQLADENAGPDGEMPDEFDADRFLTTQRKLLELRVLRDFGEAFGLGTYLERIMATRIEALFGAHPVSVTAGPDGKTSFYGSDEAYLKYRTKSSLKQGT